MTDKMRIFKTGTILFVVIFLVSCGEPMGTEPDAVESDVVEEIAEPPITDPFGLEVVESKSEPDLKIEDGFQISKYSMPDLFFERFSRPIAQESSSDPFADPEPSGPSQPTREDTPQEVLESAGVTIPEGAYANYDDETGILTVQNTVEQMELIEALIEAYNQGQEKQISIRVEVFQMSATAALQLQRATAEKSDDTAEWQIVNRMLEDKSATFVTSAMTVARSGQRSKALDVFEHIYPVEYDWDADLGSMPVSFETREVGTILEVDPVLGADDVTIDLNLSFTYHTAPPPVRSVEVSNGTASLAVTEFHAKEITTALVAISNQATLIGGWRPTGKPEYLEENVMQVAFLKADIQIVGEAKLIP